MIQYEYHGVQTHAEVDEHGDERSPKALYRRALAREGLGQLEDAEADLRDCRALAPQDKQVRSALARVALGAKVARKEREGMWVGRLPMGAAPTVGDRLYLARHLALWAARRGGDVGM